MIIIALSKNSENILPTYLCLYLNMGSHGNALAVSFFRRGARLRSRVFDHYIFEKRCGQLERFVSFNEIHVLLYSKMMRITFFMK